MNTASLHHPDCEWHVDQYDQECTCGATGAKERPTMSQDADARIFIPAEGPTDDIFGADKGDGITLTAEDGDGGSHSRLSYETALRLGEWLIGRAIAHGAKAEAN